MKLTGCRTLWVVATLLFSGVLAVAAQGGQPSADEEASLAGLKGQISGRIVWESNRTGVWELYTMNADGTGARRLTSLATPGDALAYTSYLRPRFSPDGRLILFAYGRNQAPVECWIADSSTGEARKLCAGNPLNWLPDGSGFLLLRAKQIWRYDLRAGAEALAVPLVIESASDTAGMVGYVVPDLSAGVFRFGRNEYIRLSDGEIVKTTGGCEPGLTADGRFMYWVLGPKNFRVWNTQTGEELPLLGTPPVEPYNYTYFPTVSADLRWLMYGASPSQHSHDTSDYEVYLQRLEDWQPIGQPVRLSFNTGTDRWAELFVGPSAGGSGAYDVASNRATNPPPPPVTIFSFKAEDAKPDWGGNWGLWPQAEGCGGETAWVAEDAEGGAGGSIRITYDIGAEPRSFSMWFAPGNNVDLSTYDRFVVYVRGDAPSFTLVAKDRSADPEGKTEAGIADLVVTGVTGQWQRFELPFADFVPRVAGAAIDWHAINHVGVAMMADRNATSGTVQVDNLRALPQ